ncbi:immunoglobulin superfamily member 5 isoform X2 [Phyllostomus hastatus]|uniref:immunoglobulin superfamily member 5 isoform X2 n=1 Tax=Phyllostomus hastatus TaxID=9423 RepID=UPI001E682FAC|nr:immunoglobulin superfamily member 5 isoform X2 [Phyllostomus hastatus]
MEGSWRGILAALVVVAGLPASGSSNQIIEGPRNTTALVGGEAHFNCTVSQGWRLIMWALNGTVVLSVTPKEPIITSDRFTSASYEEGGDFISEMIIHDVKFSDAGRVKCSLQNSDSEGSAFLSVQVVGKLLTPSDSLVVTEDEPCNVTCRAVGWTPLPDLSWEIGAPVSHWSYHSVPEPDDPQSALSLLALTPQGNGTVTCVANMKGLQARDSLTINLTVVPPALESSYQSEVRNSPNVKANKETLEPKFRGGNENYGYSLDEQKTKQPASLPRELHDASVLQRQRSGQAQQGPDHQQPAPTSRPQVTLFMAGPKQVRNVTLV